MGIRGRLYVVLLDTVRNRRCSAEGLQNFELPHKLASGGSWLKHPRHLPTQGARTSAPAELMLAVCSEARESREIFVRVRRRLRASYLRTS